MAGSQRILFVGGEGSSVSVGCRCLCLLAQWVMSMSTVELSSGSVVNYCWSGVRNARQIESGAVHILKPLHIVCDADIRKQKVTLHKKRTLHKRTYNHGSHTCAL